MSGTPLVLLGGQVPTEHRGALDIELVLCSCGTPIVYLWSALDSAMHNDDDGATLEKNQTWT